MTIERLEHELRTYFRCEADSVTPPLDWWQRAVTRATSTSRLPRRGLVAWARDLLDILRINPRKPFWGVATMVVVLLMLVVVSYGVGIVISNFPATGGAPITTGPAPTTGTTIT